MKISYENKIDLQEFPLVANKNKIVAADLNEIKDSVNELYTGSGGSYFFNGNAIATIISGVDTWAAVDIAAAQGVNRNFTYSENCTLTYTGTDTRIFTAGISAEIECASANQVLQIAFFVNDVQVGAIGQIDNQSTGNPVCVSVQTLLQLEHNDVITVKVLNNTSGANITVISMSVAIA